MKPHISLACENIDPPHRPPCTSGLCLDVDLGPTAAVFFGVVLMTLGLAALGAGIGVCTK